MFFVDMNVARDNVPIEWKMGKSITYKHQSGINILLQRLQNREQTFRWNEGHVLLVIPSVCVGGCLQTLEAADCCFFDR
jgi:hypothetical protein